MLFLLIPSIYSKHAPVSVLQWAVGLEFFMGVTDPWKIALTTDSPNGGPFIRYPKIISWLMSQEKLQDMLNNEVHNWAVNRTNLGTYDREYTWNEIATITRASPAKILGLNDRGHLGMGAKADVSVYDIDVENFDPTLKNNSAILENKLLNSKYTIKDGEILVKDAKIVKLVKSNHIWCKVNGLEKEEEILTNRIKPEFNKYYTIKYENYGVNEHYIKPETCVDIEYGGVICENN